MIGKPGASVFQLNGQPTAQNARETGADGDLPGMRNWQNAQHVAELAKLWNVVERRPDADPELGTAHPRHADRPIRRERSMRFLWIVGTNPAVSLPDLARVRSILRQDGLFVVVSDAFLTETGQLADVVLPAAIWGEKPEPSQTTTATCTCRSSSGTAR